MTAATARIELSRERLRLAMNPPPEPAAPRTERPVVDRLLAWPILHDVLDSVRQWWSSHPMRPVGLMASEATAAVVTPVAQRHPWLLMLGAAAVGAALVSARPWRWLLRSTLLAGLVPQVASRVARSLPIESWMTTVSAMMSAQPARRAQGQNAAQPATPRAARQTTPGSAPAAQPTSPSRTPEPAVPAQAFAGASVP